MAQREQKPELGLKIKIEEARLQTKTMVPEPIFPAATPWVESRWVEPRKSYKGMKEEVFRGQEY